MQKDALKAYIINKLQGQSQQHGAPLTEELNLFFMFDINTLITLDMSSTWLCRPPSVRGLKRYSQNTNKV